MGDTRHATDLLQQERARCAVYQPLDDTPDKVEAAVRKYQELSTLDKTTEAYRRAYARSLMEQADGLLRWGEQDEAERLAGRAASLQLTYNPFEQKPQDLLQRIAAMRRLEGTRPVAPPEGSGVIPAGAQYVVPAGANGEADRTAVHALYDPASDRTRNVRASDQQPVYPSTPQIRAESGAEPADFSPDARSTARHRRAPLGQDAGHRAVRAGRGRAEGP